MDAEPDIFFISETWYNSASIVHIEGYECFRKDRRDKGGSGVCIYGRVSSSLIFRELDFEQLRSGGIEQVWCAVDVGSESVLLGCIYRPEFLKNARGVTCDKGVHSKRDTCINKSKDLVGELIISRKFQGVILAGDFNYNEITWDQGLVPAIIRPSESADEFIGTLNSSFMTQNVYFKTFQRKCGGQTYMTNTLDLIITEGKERVYELSQGRILVMSVLVGNMRSLQQKRGVKRCLAVGDTIIGKVTTWA